jgi:hypothetical protein
VTNVWFILKGSSSFYQSFATNVQIQECNQWLYMVASAVYYYHHIPQVILEPDVHYRSIFMQTRWLHLRVEDDLGGPAFLWFLVLLDFVLVLSTIAIFWGSGHMDQARWSACIAHWQGWAGLLGWRTIDYMVSLVSFWDT